MKHIMLVALLLVSLALPAAAFAQDASEGYGQIAGAVSGGDPASGDVQTVSGDQLPFTGLEVGVVALGGALLLGGGLVLRRSHAAR